MATTPTQKPIPSEDVGDFKFNIGKADQFITSNEFFYIDRFGAQRYTAEGIRHFLAPLGNAYTLEQANAAIASGEITDGAFFFIWSDDGVNIADKYQNVGGVVTRVDGSIISTEGVVQLFNQSKEITYSVGEHYSRYESDIILLNPNKAPLLTMESADGDDKVMVSNSYGEFDLAMPASVRTAIAVDKAAGRELQKDIVYVNTEREALLVDDSPDPKVYMYQNKITGKIGVAYGFEGVATNDITPYLNGYVNSLLRAKIGAIKNNTVANAVSTILMTGDSWGDQPTLPVSLETKLKATYGDGGTGWVDFINEELMPGISVSMTGFTPLRNWEEPYDQGMFVSGKRITTTTKTGSVSVSGFSGQRVRIFYQDLNGSFRYSFNGGAYTTVNGGNTNTLKYIELTASSFSGNSIAIDTTVNTSGNTVVLFGVSSQISTGKGVCVIKAGQAGAKTADYAQVLQYLPAWAPVLLPDAVIIILGTNDIIQKRPVAEYQQSLLNLIAAWKNSVPLSVGINMLFPAHANRPVSEGYPDYSLYEKAARDVCDALKVGYMNGLGLFPDFASANSLNLWVGGTDKDHLNKNGADLFVGEFAIKNLLEI
ncbi:Uncharacterised protein [Serratia entomophila]|uniref:SGNH/GDSL hydrolase family protein n=1 Tax=Serratia entomophila TaxID=42906 RepID=UPI002178E42E|nr:SGNH/GDSL hydrolase family protein [Serratia entomophila]CAI1782174.1 Uncharacterised protein [Serratia entomophila]